jgi:hypothetical protein
LRLADLIKILACDFEARLDGLGAAGDKVDTLESRRRLLDEHIGEPLGGFGGEECRVGVGDSVELPLDRGDHRRVIVPQAGHGRAARRVEIPPTLAVDHIGAVAADRDRRLELRMPMKDLAHKPTPKRFFKPRPRRSS